MVTFVFFFTQNVFESLLLEGMGGSVQIINLSACIYEYHIDKDELIFRHGHPAGRVIKDTKQIEFCNMYQAEEMSRLDFNSLPNLPNHKILDWSKLKAFADN